MKKINKTVARKLWDNNKDFWITPCNMRAVCGILIRPASFKAGFKSFDHLINNFTYYNCNPETGLYPAYYIEEGE